MRRVVGRVEKVRGVGRHRGCRPGPDRAGQGRTGMHARSPFTLTSQQVKHLAPSFLVARCAGILQGFAKGNALALTTVSVRVYP